MGKDAILRNGGRGDHRFILLLELVFSQTSEPQGPRIHAEYTRGR
jgi:hypothetical protein